MSFLSNNTKNRILTFLRSLFWHISRGLPKSSRKTINERFAICLSCDAYDPKRSICRACGCNINNKKTFMNKLAWADQECPLGKWKRQ